MLLERLKQGAGLEQCTTSLSPKLIGIGVVLERRLVTVNDQVEPNFLRHAVAKVVHLGELVRGVDMKRGERDLARVERLLRQAQQAGGVLAHRIHEHGPLKLSRYLAHDIDTFSL